MNTGPMQRPQIEEVNETAHGAAIRFAAKASAGGRESPELGTRHKALGHHCNGDARYRRGEDLGNLVEFDQWVACLLAAGNDPVEALLTALDQVLASLFAVEFVGGEWAFARTRIRVYR